jgi:hypothetical protein
MALKDKIKIPKYTLGEEIFSSVSHGVGALLSIAALVLCVVFSALHKNVYAVVASAIYGSTSIILYVMSTLYHAFKVNNAKRVLRILDHSSIFLLIAGTYTPYALVALPKTLGWVIFSINWGCAVIGIILNSIDLEKYKKIVDLTDGVNNPDINIFLDILKPYRTLTLEELESKMSSTKKRKPKNFFHFWFYFDTKIHLQEWDFML